jgi:sarcosine dehydrogenase
MLWRFRPLDYEVELNIYTREMCIKLEEMTGEESWRENGGLFIANNKERLDEYKRLSEIGKLYNIPSEVVSPAEAAKIHPLLKTDDTYGAIYSPTDGTIDPTAIVTAYTKAAKKLGA